MQDFDYSSVSSFLLVALLSGLIGCPWEIYPLRLHADWPKFDSSVVREPHGALEAEFTSLRHDFKVSLLFHPFIRVLLRAC